jgi:metal-responsive CopG/Arc/MetJ family transcriptional regulator
MEISVKLPNNLYQDVSQLAQAKKKSVAEFVKNAVRKAVAEESETLERPLADCSDAEVLAVANMKMSKEQADRQSELLYKNQADTLTPIERNELESILLVYQVGNLRKSQGIAEAVLRGLIKTPDDLQ